MAHRYKENKTKDESLYVEDRVDESLYTEPLRDEDMEEEKEVASDELSIYQRPEDDNEVDEDESENEDEEEEDEPRKKKGLFGFLHRKHQEEDEEEEDDEDDDDEDEEEEEEEDDEFLEESKPYFNKKVIIGVAAAAIVIVGGVIFIVRGLGGSAEGEAYVEEVGRITGFGSGNGMNNRYTGEVEPQSSWKITLDNDLSVSKCYVKVGDIVKKGDKLFKYDTEELQLSYERQQLEIETLKNESTELTKQITTYQNDMKTANASEKIELQTQILTNQTQVKKNEFSLKSANDELKKIKNKIKDATVKSKMDGVIKSVNEKLGQGSSSISNDNDNSDSSDGDNTYMTILATGDFRVKGKINETNMHEISEGDPVIVRSRVNDDTWSGTISQIKTDSVADSDTADSGYIDYSSGSSGESTSKYNFYVSLTGDDGLMMGQHVFIELDNGQDEEQEGIWLPTAYLSIDGDDFFVWKDHNGKLKKEKVEVGEYNEMLDTYQVTSGIEEDDYIAVSDESLEQNMKTTKTEPKNIQNEEEGIPVEEGMPAVEEMPEDINPDGSVG